EILQQGGSDHHRNHNGQDANKEHCVEEEGDEPIDHAEEPLVAQDHVQDNLGNDQHHAASDAQAEADRQNGQYRPQASLQVVAELAEIKIREGGGVSVFSSPETDGQPAQHYHDSDDGDQNTDTGQQKVFDVVRLFEKVGDGI